MKSSVKWNHLSVVIGLWSILATAQSPNVPQLINYQGRLANADGGALVTGDYALSFSIYDSAERGTKVWGPQVFDGVTGSGHGLKVSVVQGYFNTLLGHVDTNGIPIAAAFGSNNRFIEISVGTNPPILPRQQVLSAPFALNAGRLTRNPEVGTNVDVGGIAMSGSITTEIEEVTGPSAKLVEGSKLNINCNGGVVEVSLVSALGANSSIRLLSGLIVNPPPNQKPERIEFSLWLLRDGVPVGSQNVRLEQSGDINIPSSQFKYIDQVGPGRHTYELQAFVSDGVIYMKYKFEGVRVMAREL